MQFFPHSATKHPSNKRPQDSFKHRILNDPFLDWIYMIIIVLVLAGVYIGVGYTTYLDMQAKIDAAPTTNVTNPLRIFDQAALSRTLRFFDQRAQKRAESSRGYVGVGDPSQ